MLVILAMLAIIAGQWVIIWQLLNRVLVAHNVPALTPVAVEKEEQPVPPPVRRRLFTLPIPE